MPPPLEDIHVDEYESLSAARRNCLVCTGVGTNLCDEHRKDVLDIAVNGHLLPESPMLEGSELIDLCREILLAPLGVY